MLTVREHMALDAESRHWRYPGARAAYLRNVLGMSETRHAQVVAGMLDRADAEAAYPVLVRRLRRLRDARRGVRRAA